MTRAPYNFHLICLVWIIAFFHTVHSGTSMHRRPWPPLAICSAVMVCEVPLKWEISHSFHLSLYLKVIFMLSQRNVTSTHTFFLKDIFQNFKAPSYQSVDHLWCFQIETAAFFLEDYNFWPFLHASSLRHWVALKKFVISF